MALADDPRFFVAGTVALFSHLREEMKNNDQDVELPMKVFEMCGGCEHPDPNMTFSARRLLGEIVRFWRANISQQRTVTKPMLKGALAILNELKPDWADSDDEDLDVLDQAAMDSMGLPPNEEEEEEEEGEDDKDEKDKDQNDKDQNDKDDNDDDDDDPDDEDYKSGGQSDDEPKEEYQEDDDDDDDADAKDKKVASFKQKKAAKAKAKAPAPASASASASASAPAPAPKRRKVLIPKKNAQASVIATSPAAALVTSPVASSSVVVQAFPVPPRN